MPRSIWKGAISFGLVYVPVALYPASQEDDIDFDWHGLISGDESGRIEYVFDGRAEAVCPYNRIGICVHHPIAECAGRPCRVEHGDGTTRDGAFPLEIAPHQAETAAEAARQAGFAEVRVLDDFTFRPRVLVARRG